MLSELVPMWRESFEHGVGVIDPHPIAEQAKYFEDQVAPENSVTVALLDGRMLGFVACSPESINQLHVRVGHHRQGIGSQLLNLAKEGSSGSLWLYTFARNRVARRFYEKHGFNNIAEGFEPVWQLEDVKYQWVRTGPGRHSSTPPVDQRVGA